MVRRRRREYKRGLWGESKLKGGRIRGASLKYRVLTYTQVRYTALPPPPPPPPNLCTFTSLINSGYIAGALRGMKVPAIVYPCTPTLPIPSCITNGILCAFLELTVEEWIQYLEEKKKQGMTPAQLEEYERRKKARIEKDKERAERLRQEEEEKRKKTREKIDREMR